MPPEPTAALVVVAPDDTTSVAPVVRLVLLAVAPDNKVCVIVTPERTEPIALPPPDTVTVEILPSSVVAEIVPPLRTVIAALFFMPPLISVPPLDTVIIPMPAPLTFDVVVIEPVKFAITKIPYRR